MTIYMYMYECIVYKSLHCTCTYICTLYMYIHLCLSIAIKYEFFQVKVVYKHYYKNKLCSHTNKNFI